MFCEDKAVSVVHEEWSGGKLVEFDDFLVESLQFFLGSFHFFCLLVVYVMRDVVPVMSCDQDLALFVKDIQCAYSFHFFFYF